jgi:hypothetical protein
MLCSWPSHQYEHCLLQHRDCTLISQVVTKFTCQRKDGVVGEDGEGLAHAAGHGAAQAPAELPPEARQRALRVQEMVWLYFIRVHTKTMSGKSRRPLALQVTGPVQQMVLHHEGFAVMRACRPRDDNVDTLLCRMQIQLAEHTWAAATILAWCSGMGSAECGSSGSVAAAAISPRAATASASPAAAAACGRQGALRVIAVYG